jgi:carboxymethylenebutenolidase
MLIQEDHVDLQTSVGVMRTFMFRPAAAGSFPGIVLFGEIYQMTGPIARTARMLASHGYIVAVPETYHDFEPPGSPFEYNAQDTDKGNRYKTEKTLQSYDDDARACIDHLLSRDECNGRLGCVGICLGGHLSVRCALNPEIQAGVSFYATDIHSRTLARGKNDNTIDRLAEIRGEMLMIWGKQDPHIPPEGRQLIYRAMADSGVNFTWHEFNAQHAFIRDEGYRYNQPLAEICHAMMFELFDRVLQLGVVEPESSDKQGC